MRWVSRSYADGHIGSLTEVSVTVCLLGHRPGAFVELVLDSLPAYKITGLRKALIAAGAGNL